MKFSTMSKRFAATGAATALAAGALVGLTSSAATAAPVTTTYTCEYAAASLGPWTVVVESDAPGIEAVTQIPAGLSVGPAFLSVTNTFTIPAAAREALQAYNVEDIAFADYKGSFGSTDILVEGPGMATKVSEMTDNGDETYSFDIEGANAAFEVPAAGVHDVVSPDDFNMVATVPGLGPVPVPCVLAEGTAVGAYHTITVTKNASTATGTPVKSTLKVGKVAKLKATVKADNETPSGKVIVKEGSKKLGSATLNDAGKATVKMGKLKKGKHTVKVIYKGDGYTEGDTSGKIVFKVTK